jgi:cytosine/creatinine deaminase
MDLIVRNARLSCDPVEPVDIAVRDGKIAAIGKNIAGEARETLDAGGRLVCGGFCETHIHLEKSRIIDRCAPEQGRNAMAVRRVSDVKHTFTVEDVMARARQTLEGCIANGATRMRAHVEVDPKVGLRGFEGVKRLAQEYAWAIDVEICVFPQEGLTNNPGTEELMVAALRDGATVVGAAPGYDTDHAAQIRRVFELGREFDVDIDMHLDFGNTPDDMDIPLVCTLTEQYGLGGRVTVGHMTRLSTMKIEDLRVMASRIADAGVAVTVLPATELFLMGRDQTDNVRRGLADVNLLAEHGVNCSLSTNNVLNPFTPMGDCSLIRMANLQANCCQIGSRAGMRELFSMLTERSARLLRLEDYGLAVGNPADLVVIDAESPEQAVAELRQPLAVYKRGRRTVSRTRPVIHHPR